MTEKAIKKAYSHASYSTFCKNGCSKDLKQYFHKKDNVFSRGRRTDDS